MGHAVTGPHWPDGSAHDRPDGSAHDTSFHSICHGQSNCSCVSPAGIPGWVLISLRGQGLLRIRCISTEESFGMLQIRFDHNTAPFRTRFQSEAMPGIRRLKGCPARPEVSCSTWVALQRGETISLSAPFGTDSAYAGGCAHKAAMLPAGVYCQ